MTPRAIRSPHLGRKRTLLVAGLAAVLALILAAPSASAALATLTSISTIPASPTTCDSVSLVVAGTTPTPCYEIVFTELNGPVELPTMGPIPTYEIRVRIVLRPTLAPGGACPTVLQPYRKELALPQLLRFGRYQVRAVEFLAQNGSESPQDTLTSSFDVTSSDACAPRSCVLLGFGSAGDLHCDASAPPGGRASLPITLTNPVPVGGVQTVVTPEAQLFPVAGSVTADSHLVVVPVDVVTTDRTAAFQIAWTAEGTRARVLVYSTSGAEIAPGQGPIFRVIYQVSSHAVDQVQLVRLGESIVADPLGETIPPCPTVASFTVDWGRICIGAPACDLNGDGASNILDIVLLVNCALTGDGGSDGCPDSATARADCNGDGSIDIRDVICCVRKILGSGGIGMGDPGSGTGEPTRIGFEGAVEWISPLTGRARIKVQPGAAGIDFAITAAQSGARIAGMRLEPGSGYQLESRVSPDHTTARAMLFAVGGTAAGAADGAGGSATGATIVLDLTPSLAYGGWGSLAFSAAWSANRLAQQVPTLLEPATTPVPQIVAPVTPTVAAARPNPFRDETEIVYALPTAARATMRVYSASGRLVRTLVDSERPAGVHQARWDGKDSSGRPVSSGIYFFRFSAAEVTKTQRLMLLR